MEAPATMEGERGGLGVKMGVLVKSLLTQQLGTKSPLHFLSSPGSMCFMGRVLLISTWPRAVSVLKQSPTSWELLLSTVQPGHLFSLSTFHPPTTIAGRDKTLFSLKRIKLGKF